MPKAYTTEETQAEFWRRVDVRGDDECHPWLGSLVAGYGMYRGKYAHRTAYELHHGALPPYHPKRSVIRHTCDNRPCCNWRHLVHGTTKQNNDDTVERGRAGDTARRTLNDKLVALARKLYATKRFSVDAIARRIGVSYETMRGAINGTSWKHLPGAVPTVKPERVNRPSLIPTGDEERAVKIKRRLAKGKTVASTAYRFGVSYTTAWQIGRGILWPNTEPLGDVLPKRKPREKP